VRIIHVNLAKGFRGGERQTVLLIQELEKMGVNQALVCRKGSPMIVELARCKCQIHTIKRPLVSVFLSLRILIKPETLIHAHEAKASQWAYLQNLITKTPYIITRRIQKRPGNSWFTKRVYKTALAVVSISSSIASTMTDYLTYVGATRTESKVIPSACAEYPKDDLTDSLRDQFPGKFMIGHIGALSIAEKGQDIIVESARKLEVAYPRLQFILIGEGKDRAILESEAKGLKNISFLGFRSNIGDFLSSLDAFVFPSRHEGLGSSLLDALSFKLPIIASDIPGITDIIRNGENGLLIKPADSDALCTAIEQLYTDEALRAKLIAGTGEALSGFRPKEVAKKISELYRSQLPSL